MISKQDKKVVDFFYEGKSLNGKLLKTNGKKLEKTGLGSQTIAIKVGNNFKIVAKMDSKSTQSVVNYIKKSFPKDVILNNKKENKTSTPYFAKNEQMRKISRRTTSKAKRRF